MGHSVDDCLQPSELRNESAFREATLALKSHGHRKKLFDLLFRLLYLERDGALDPLVLDDIGPHAALPGGACIPKDPYRCLRKPNLRTTTQDQHAGNGQRQRSIDFGGQTSRLKNLIETRCWSQLCF